MPRRKYDGEIIVVADQRYASDTHTIVDICFESLADHSNRLTVIAYYDADRSLSGRLYGLFTRQRATVFTTGLEVVG